MEFCSYSRCWGGLVVLSWGGVFTREILYVGGECTVLYIDT